MARKRNVLEFPVMKRQCDTCPFGPKGDPRTLAAVIDRSIKFKGSQLCHHSKRGKPHLCRRARDLQLDLMFAMGMISAPTDEAFNRKWKELREAPCSEQNAMN